MEIISEAREREPPIIRARLLKRRRREVKVDPCLVVMEDPMLGGHGRSHARWSMEYPMFGGHARWSMEDPMLGGHGM